jgi:uncharacterized lipoprotein YddW (UPF0748 family)
MKSRLALAILLFPMLLVGQSVPDAEFRGAWIATVANLDWPTSRTATVAAQQADLIGLLNQLKAAGTNAVLFQVRTEGDALYDSQIEPWSYYLTGVEGQAPNPYWDPLAFAVEEAHKRGMELHAWLNPYRADRVPGLFTRASNHITVTNPEWIITATSASSSIKIMNPGIPEVRDRITAVVMDIVRRYDIDGIHFDDYFYPYPPNDMGFGTPRWDLDLATFQQYGGGFSVRSDWRRHNINTMVKAVHDSIKTAKPHVKFGISPFGIWKNGVPSGIVGMDAYNVIYADAPAWLTAGSVDYLTPQLYWRYGGGQDYGKLAPWWAEQTAPFNRHLYHGLAAHQLAASWVVGDITRQVQYNQSDDRIQGQVMFRARMVANNVKNIADSLMQYYYPNETFTPRADWLPTSTPPAPVQLLATREVDGPTASNHLTWERPVYAAASNDTLLFYLVTKTQMTAVTKGTADQTQADFNESVLIGNTTWVDNSPYGNTSYKVYSVGRNGSISMAASADVYTTDIERDPEIASGIHLDQNFPNPFNPSTVIGFQLSVDSEVNLSVFDVLGRRVAVLANSRMPQGQHQISFDASSLSSGVYLYVLSAGDMRIAKRMTLIK